MISLTHAVLVAAAVLGFCVLAGCAKPKPAGGDLWRIPSYQR